MKKLYYKIIPLSLILCLAISVIVLSNKITTQRTSKTIQNQPNNTVQIQYDYEKYKDLKAMKKDASTVFQGTVVKINKPVKLVQFYISDNKNRPYYAAYTISDIQVEKVMKGDLNSGDIIQVKQLGGFIDDKTWNSKDEPLLTEGTQGIFFTDPYKVNNDYPPSILMFEQGIFKIENGTIKFNKLQKDLVINTELNENSKDLSTNIKMEDFPNVIKDLTD